MSTLCAYPRNLDPAQRARLHDAAKVRAHALRQAAIHRVLDRGASALAAGARRLAHRIVHGLTPGHRPGLEG